MQNLEIETATYAMEKWEDGEMRNMSGVAIVTFKSLGRKVAMTWNVTQEERDKPGVIEISMGSPNLDQWPNWAHRYVMDKFSWKETSMNSVMFNAIASWNNDMDNRARKLKQAHDKAQGQKANTDPEPDTPPETERPEYKH